MDRNWGDRVKARNLRYLVLVFLLRPNTLSSHVGYLPLLVATTSPQTSRHIRQEDRPCITDAEYDALRLRSQAIENLFPDLVSPQSPSLRVGAVMTETVPSSNESSSRTVDSSRSDATETAGATTGGATRVRLPYVQHLRPLGSLDNVFADEKAREFVERVCRAADVATLGEGGVGVGELPERNDRTVHGDMVDPAEAEAAPMTLPAVSLNEAAQHARSGNGHASNVTSAAADDENDVTIVTSEGARKAPPAPQMSFVAEPKIDGLTCALLYENGRLVRAATRGDGVRGEDVTPNALALGKAVLPHTLVSPPPPLKDGDKGLGRGVEAAAAAVVVPPRLEVRGEIFMPEDSFVRLNAEREAEGLPPFATARNAAAGSLRQLDPEVSRGRGLGFFAYGAAVGDGHVGGHNDVGGGAERDEGDDARRGLSLADVFGTQVRSGRGGGGTTNPVCLSEMVVKDVLSWSLFSREIERVVRTFVLPLFFFFFRFCRGSVFLCVFPPLSLVEGNVESRCVERVRITSLRMRMEKESNYRGYLDFSDRMIT